jgi:predicted nucleic acid-binding protein
MGVCELVINESVLDEVRHVLARRQLGLDPSAQRRAVAYLGRCVTVLNGPPWDAIRSSEGRLRDPRDLRVLLGFELSGADHLVTGDADLRRVATGA